MEFWLLWDVFLMAISWSEDLFGASLPGKTTKKFFFSHLALSIRSLHLLPSEMYPFKTVKSL